VKYLVTRFGLDLFFHAIGTKRFLNKTHTPQTRSEKNTSNSYTVTEKPPFTVPCTSPDLSDDYDYLFTDGETYGLSPTAPRRRADGICRTS
jgi:hypothetical protein